MGGVLSLFGEGREGQREAQEGGVGRAVQGLGRGGCQARKGVHGLRDGSEGDDNGRDPGGRETGATPTRRRKTQFR